MPCDLKDQEAFYFFITIAGKRNEGVEEGMQVRTGVAEEYGR